MESTLRRAATEATARALRGEGFQSPPPLNVFLSHAKRDGQEIAQSIRDGVRNFGQLVAWFDANDLPYGAAWESPKGTLVWKVQPVVAVHQPGTGWVRGVPMLDGVPRIGWNPNEASDITQRIVDRLVLEVLLGHVHRKVALALDKTGNHDRKSCYITWVPDAWTLASLHQQLKRRALSIDRIVYPGYGLTAAEISELQPVIETFKKSTRLVSFEETMT